MKLALAALLFCFPLVEFSSAQATADDIRAEIESVREEIQRLRQQGSRSLQDDVLYADDLNQKVMELKISRSEQASAMSSIWIFVCGTLCMFMHVGFSMVETGSCRARNASDLLIKNVLSVCVAALAWWSIGWGFAFGETANGLIGTTGFFATNLLEERSGAVVPVSNCTGGTCTAKVLQCFFQWAFCSTTASIVSGAVAERIRSSTFALYSFCMAGLVYPVVVAWTWGGGWLSTLLQVGITDLAGSGVVHFTGGIAGLVGAIVVGPREGRFGQTGSFEPHNLPLAVLGTLFLWIGWFGFNAGSIGAFHNGLQASSAAQIAMNTAVAGAAGGITVFILKFVMLRKYDVGGLCNGILAGVVSISAGCGNLTNLSAIIVAVVGGLLYVASASLLLRLRIDDPVNAFPVHGVCGFWGCLAAVLWDWGGFDRFHGSSGWQCFPVSSTDSSCFVDAKWLALVAQLIFLACVLLWAGGLSLIIFGGARLLGILRVDHDAEEKGIDATEHAQNRAYNFQEQQGPNSWRVLWFQ